MTKNPPSAGPSVFVRHVGALGAVLVALALALPLRELPALPPLLFFAGMIASSLYGGWWPGLLATLTSILVLHFGFPTSASSPLSELLLLSLFLLAGVGVSFLSERRRRTEDALRQLNQELDDKLGERTAELFRTNATLKEEMADRKRARDAIQQYVGIVESSEDAIIAKDLDGIIISWNRAAERLFGYRADEIRGESIEVLISPEHSHGLPEIMERIKRGDHIKHYETIRIAKDGREIDVSLSISPIKDTHGKVIGASTIARDISERKLGERRQGVQHATTRILATAQTLEEAAPKILKAMCTSLGWEVGGLWRVDPQAGVLRCVDMWHVPTAAAKEFDALSREVQYPPGGGLPGRIWSSGKATWVPDVVGDASLPRAAACSRAGLHGAFGFPILLNNQVVGVAEFYNRQVEEPDKQLLAMVAAIGSQVGQFIDRRQAEQALRESEKRFQAFMDNNPAVAYIKDLEGRYVYVNRPLQNHFSFKVTDWLGKTVHDIWPADNAEKYRESDLKVLSERRPLEVTETVPALDGSPRHWMVLKFPFEDASGRRFLGGVALDVSERKRTEEALLKTEEQFRQAQKMEAVGRLAGGVAHDFNNLLTAIMGYSELMLYGRSAGDPVYEDVQEIKKAAEQAAHLTRQLLAFSRKQMLEPKVLDLNTVVMDTGRMLNRLIGEDIELTHILEPHLGRVKADLGQLEQVIMNLVVNARDAMPKGGKIVFRTSNIDRLNGVDGKPVDNGPPLRYVMLSVTDTGCGMDASTQARIFEPFFTTKEPGKGTGLGLATVYGIVQQSGGRIDVESEVGEGTTFRIFLPRTDEVPPLRKSSPGLRKAPGGKETVLLVEDEHSVRALTQRILQQCGYTVLEARDGAQALQICAEHGDPIHLLVSDVVMPGMNGRELAERILALRPGTRVLYLTGYTDDAVVRHGVLLEEVALLQKPFSASALANKVREMLDG